MKKHNVQEDVHEYAQGETDCTWECKMLCLLCKSMLSWKASAHNFPSLKPWISTTQSTKSTVYEHNNVKLAICLFHVLVKIFVYDHAHHKGLSQWNWTIWSGNNHTHVKNPVHKQVYVETAAHEHVKTVAHECVFVKNTFHDNVPVKNNSNEMQECEKHCSWTCVCVMLAKSYTCEKCYRSICQWICTWKECYL